MIVSITSYNISTQLESAIRNKKLTEEELADAHKGLSYRKQEQWGKIKIGIITMSVMLGLLGIPMLINADDNIGLALVFFLTCCAIFAFAIYLAWYVNVGKIVKQWNKLIRDYYPEICDKYKL